MPVGDRDWGSLRAPPDGIDPDHGEHAADTAAKVGDLEEGMAVGDVVVLATFVELHLTGLKSVPVSEVRGPAPKLAVHLVLFMGDDHARSVLVHRGKGL